MINLEIINTNLAKIDLSTCNINNMKVDLENLKGCILNQNQAIAVVNLLDIIIKE